MPSENLASQSQARPQLGGATSRSNSTIAQDDSPSTSPSRHHAGKAKTQKHVVHGGRIHTRVPSNKGLHKLTKAHGNEGSNSQADLKKSARNSSTSSLKKNSSHVSLKRNRSSAEVRPKSSRGQTSVHFEIGDEQEAEEGWEEASSSASPALSRSASRPNSGHSSQKPSADNSRPQTPPQESPQKPQGSAANGSNERSTSRHSAIITEKLLARTQSHNTTKMSLATATPSSRAPDSPERSQSSTANGTPHTGSNPDGVPSRFVGGSGTPGSSSPLLQQTRHSDLKADEVKRAHSMGNLARHNTSSSDGEESALAPRSRKSSTQHNSYVPPQHSRTQQKLWLQRASSNIEPTQMAPGVVNGFAGLHGSMGGPSLLGAGYNGRDPRIKLQLEKTGLEYLVVRRHQDPVGQALKRLSQLPGAEKNRRIPHQANPKKGDTGNGAAGSVGAGGRYGLSQSLKESRGAGPRKENHAHTLSTGSTAAFDGNQEESGLSGDTTRENGDEGIGALLRALWEKNYDLSASAD